jgi:hypothetical protein
MSKNNIYPLVGPAYPLLIPVHPSKLRSKWLAWGRTPPPILPLGGGGDPYFQRRAAPTTAPNQGNEFHTGTSYPRVINEFTKEDI